MGKVRASNSGFSFLSRRYRDFTLLFPEGGESEASAAFERGGGVGSGGLAKFSFPAVYLCVCAGGREEEEKNLGNVSRKRRFLNPGAKKEQKKRRGGEIT